VKSRIFVDDVDPRKPLTTSGGKQQSMTSFVSDFLKHKKEGRGYQSKKKKKGPLKKHWERRVGGTVKKERIGDGGIIVY